MPSNLTYPGVYIEEIPSGVRTIVGVSTSTTAFVGRARKGPLDQAVVIHNFGDFDRIFGGHWELSRLSFAVNQYFQNGGSDAVIVRVGSAAVPPTVSKFDLDAEGNATFPLEAANSGTWGEDLRISVDHDTKDPADLSLFNLTVSDIGSGTVETFRNLTTDEDAPSFYNRVLARSELVKPAAPLAIARPVPVVDKQSDSAGGDGASLDSTDVVPAASPPLGKKGIYALEDADIFNLLCLPPLDETRDVDMLQLADAALYCRERRAFLLVDSPSGAINPALAKQEHSNLLQAVAAENRKNVALFFPRLRAANPLKDQAVEEFYPCGAVAGVIARTDSRRGIWKAPAGQEAGLSGTLGPAYKMTDLENGDLNPFGVNCIRSFPLFGTVVWGSRTLDGADAFASEWKYTPVRRLALFLEESLYRGTKWVVFEPNDEPLWAQVRLNVGAFMNNLFRQGAFQGSTPREAYLVKCDKETTTQNDINLGIVNIVVGFAPLKPAEFVVLKIQQLAGQLQT